MVFKNIAKVAEKRNKNDEYVTPFSMVQQLLDHHDIPKTNIILEPCCSTHKTIPTVLYSNGYNDVRCNTYEKEGVGDFFDWTEVVDTIITNIPYGIKNFVRFMSKMKEIARHEIICLFPINYLNGKERYKIYQDVNYPLAVVYPFTRFSTLTSEASKDGRYKGGMTLYAWFVFRRGYVGDCIMKQINNDAYIIADIRGAYKT